MVFIYHIFPWVNLDRFFSLVVLIAGGGLKMSTTAVERLMRDLKRLQQDAPPSDDDIMLWIAIIVGAFCQLFMFPANNIMAFDFFTVFSQGVCFFSDFPFIREYFIFSQSLLIAFLVCFVALVGLFVTEVSLKF